MAKRVRVRLHLPGINAIMKSQEIENVLASWGDHYARRAREIGASPDYSYDVRPGNRQSAAFVHPSNMRGVINNSKTNALEKAFRNG